MPCVKSIFIGLLAATVLASPVSAQVIGYLDANGNPQAVSPTTPLPIGSGAGVAIIQGTATASISVAATTGVIISHSGTKVTYITHLDGLIGATADNVTLEYGTGSTCGTGTTVLPTWQFAANAGISLGGGLGPVIIIPSGKDVCINSNTATFKGEVTYTQQ